MGLCIDPEDTPYGISFEIRSHSVIINDNGIYPGSYVELDKSFLRKLRGLLNDKNWESRLTECEK